MIDHKGIGIKSLILFMLCMECHIPSVLADGEIRCIEREREALLRFKQGLIDDYGILSSWGSEDDKKECCEWERVWCSNTTGHVTGLPLHGDWSDDRNSFYGIRGKISSALLELRHLNYLNLSYNDFGGDGIPEFIGSIKSLETLHLRFSNFSGTVPPQLGNLTNLRDLDLSDNDFGGLRVPKFIGSIKSLEILHLSYSNFSGTVPPQLGNLPNLRYLDLSGNDFGGVRVPEFIGSIKSLEILHLSYSNFSGIVPPQLGNLPNLRYLDLSGNDFGGVRVPEFIGSIKSLETLYLRYSNFSGTIPPQLGNLTNLRDLDLSSNDFGGDRVPEFIGSIKSLEILHLSYSNFSGTVPPQLGNLPNLRYLNLSGNDFEGVRVPEFIGYIKSLETLHLSDSNFSGIIPPQLGNLTNLRDLDLSYNYKKFENLNWLSHLSLLSRLDLSGNDLSNTNWLQPILKLHSLQELHLASSDIGDVIPPSGPFVNSSFTSLSTLDLSFNEFTSSTIDWLFNTSTSLVSIYMPSNKLDRIPKPFENLSRLQYLSLHHNDLEGRLDELLGNLSARGTVSQGSHVNLSSNHLKTLSALRVLSLGSNKLTGPVPLSLGRLSELEVLDLSFNSLEGTISEANFMKLHNLQFLDLSFNSLTMQIAPDWSPPFQSWGISLAHCNVGPHFPNWIQTQSNLRWLDLSYNGISNEIPKWLWSFSPGLWRLILSSNQISGTIPDLSSTSIELIDVSSNKISGPIPFFPPRIWFVQFSQNMFSGSISSICNTSSYGRFNVLDLSNNQLAGELPACWEKMNSLDYLNLAHNSFSGDIPHALGTLQNLKALHLRDNHLTGELPSTLKNCRNLMLFDIGRNKLTGNIPAWIGANYIYIAYMILLDNRFYGSIPSEICNLTQIQILDLSENTISGEIPQCFDKFASLVEKSAAGQPIGMNYRMIFSSMGYDITTDYVEYALVQWKGQESEYNKTLEFLRLIDLSSNRLVGSIPRSFSSLKGLISLNLSRNSLTGNIIPDIGQMEMLEVLDLSRNQLSGEIPIGLAQLHFLANLDLANNNLSGEIPLGTQLQSFNASAYAGNSALCGLPLALCPGDHLNPSINNDGSVTLSSVQEFCISVVLGFTLGFWGVVGSLILKRSWRSAYFNFLDGIGDWLHTTAIIFLRKFR